MNCSHTFSHTLSHTLHPALGCRVSCSDAGNAAPKPRYNAIVSLLLALVTAEPSNRPQPLAVQPAPRWFGVLKSLVWVLISIGLGLLLATLCS